MASGFLASMHAADAPPQYVHEALKWYTGLKEQQAEQQTANDRQRQVATEEELRNELGNNYRPELQNMANTFAAYGDADLYSRIASARTADGTLLGDDPTFLRSMMGMSRVINPMGTVTPNQGQTPMQTIQSELATIRAEMKDTNSDYYTNETKQARYRELLDMEAQYSKQG